MTATTARPALLSGPYVDQRDLGPATPLADLARAFLQDQQDKGRGERTLVKYDRYLRELLDFLERDGGTMTVRDLDLRTLKAYSTYLGRRPLGGSKDGSVAPATKNLHLIVLRGLLRFGVLLDLPLPAPEQVTLMKAPLPSPDARHLESARLERLMVAPLTSSYSGLRDRALLELLLASGCRISEVIGLERDKVELDPLAPDPADGIRVVDEVTVFGKGRRHRKVYLTVRAREWLAAYLRTRKDRDPALFVTSRRKVGGDYRMSVRKAEQIVAETARRAGLAEDVSPHWLRHAAITEWTTKLGLPAAQRLAGHRDIASTSRYLGGSDAELKELYQKRIG